MKLLTIIGAFATILSVSTASAATLASLEIGGGFATTNGPSGGSISVTGGSFEGLLLTNDVNTVHDLVLGLTIVVDGVVDTDIQNVPLVTDSLSNVYNTVVGFIMSDPDISAAVSFILSTPAATIPLPDATLTYAYAMDLVQPANGFSGTFDLTITTLFELPDFIPAMGSGEFNIFATIGTVDAPVPLPASLPLLGMAFGGLVVMRKRRAA